MYHNLALTYKIKLYNCKIKLICFSRLLYGDFLSCKRSLPLVTLT